jgi:hypothetical protein
MVIAAELGWFDGSCLLWSHVEDEIECCIGAEMLETIEIHSRVGRDGVLDVHVPLGEAEADQEVLVTIRSLQSTPAPRITDRAAWHAFVEETYGSCAGLGVELHPQGPPEEREPIE